MRLALLVDFGSTYTKAAAIDLEREDVAAWAYAPSTVGSDVMIGLEAAHRGLLQQLGRSEVEWAIKRACSSAAGGLRMVAVGLVPKLTLEAARQAALGAGAKLVASYAYRMSAAETKTIVADHRPDILLLAGGTNGGDAATILHNARQLADAEIGCPVIIAGNSQAADEVASVLRSAGRVCKIVDNVLPEVDTLNIEPAREAIREIFIDRVIHAKGIDRAQSFVESILMPTPLAVLRGCELLGQGTTGEAGIGDLVAIDVGGATTDVCSVAWGRPRDPGVIQKGLPEPFAKRTVEGDLGIRYNAEHIVALVGPERVTAHLRECGGADHLPITETASYLSSHVDFLPQSTEQALIDLALARTAVDVATERHAGVQEVVPTITGPVTVQRGKDLTSVRQVLGIGGIFAFGRQADAVLAAAMFAPQNPASLRPREAELWIDKRYIMFAVGLLADVEPAIALRTLKRNLVSAGCMRSAVPSEQSKASSEQVTCSATTPINAH